MSVGRLARAAALVALFGLVSRVLGFLREAVLAASFGTSAASDAFVSALLLVNSVAAVLLYTLVTLVIPVFQQERERHGAPAAWRLLGAIAAWTGMGLIVLTGLAAIWPAGPAALFGFDDDRSRELEQLIRIMAPALALQGVSALFTAMLQIHRRFAGPAAVGIVFNLGIIVGVVVGRETIGIEAAGWGVAAGAVLQVLLQLPQFLGLVRANRARPALRHPRLRGVAVLAVPVMGASVLQQVNNFTDKLFAATLEEGRVAALSFANAMGQMPRAALLVPMMTPLFPEIARLVAQRREGDAVRAFERAAGLLSLVALPIALLMALYAQELTQVAFGRGRCDSSCVEEITDPLVFYALALPAGFISYLCNRTLSAGNQQRQIMISTTITVALTIALDIVLLGPLEQAGLALATAIALYVQVAMLLGFLARRYPDLSLAGLGRRQLRTLVCAALALTAAAVLDLALPTDSRTTVELLGLWIAKLAVAAGVFLIAARFLARAELREAQWALGALGRRRGERR